MPASFSFSFSFLVIYSKKLPPWWWWWESNHSPQVSEATTLPIEPPPLLLFVKVLFTQACLSSFNYNLLVEIKANESCLNTLLSSFVKRKNKSFDIIEVFYLLIFAIKLLKQLKFVFFLRRILIWSNSAVFATERRIRRLRSAAIKIVFDAECLFPNVALKRLFTTFQATPVVFLAPRRFLWRHLTGVSVLT